jgi:conjugative transposon TraN protein
MKKLIYCLGILLMALHSYAQNTPLAEGVKKTGLPIVYLPSNVTIHFISPEPIQYVDISTSRIIGDLPLKNVLRIKQAADTSKGKSGLFGEDAVITIAGEKFIAQYQVIFANEITARDTRTDIEILPSDRRPLDISGIGLSQVQLKKMALDLITLKTGEPKEKAKAFGITGTVNHIYTVGDYLFLDLGYRNNTKLRYDIEDFTFKVDDKKVTKASNVQSVELKPVFVLLDNPSFGKNYRNIFVFKKISFPGNKILHAELSEKQLSGRIIILDISYKDVLDADTLPY